MLQNRNFPVQRYVCISSRGPLPPLDLELYPRAAQVVGHRQFDHPQARGPRHARVDQTDKRRVFEAEAARPRWIVAFRLL